MTATAFRASSHFGLGPAPGELERITSKGAESWLREQLAVQPVPEALADLPPTADTLQAMARFRSERARARSDPELDPRMAADYLRRHMLPQFTARLDAAVETAAPFRERLVWFWSNHFTVSTAGARTLIATSCVGYENEAIRAHLDGRFADMLRAAVGHPVMLAYMDNLQSFAAGSELGRRRGRGVNENLAREVLELHTLGVGGGYSQDDVVALAGLLSGWSMEDGNFRFRADGHDPEPLRLLGRRYPEPGLARGEAALEQLAEHPATARFIAGKLAAHFQNEAPDPDLVSTLEKAFRESGGHLPSVHGALLDALLDTDVPVRKLRSPLEFLVAALRGLGGDAAAPMDRLEALASMGQFPFQAPSPAGWPDTAEHWGSPTALLKRIDWANAAAARLGSVVRPRALAEFMLPPDAESARRAIAAAESAAQGLTLLLAAPEFQWRGASIG